jgi:hypothetical protein
MKKILILFVILIAGCSWFKKLDPVKAKTVVEALEQKIGAGDYAGLSQYYSDEMNSSETTEQRADKFQKLHDAMGDFQSMECVYAKDSTDGNDINCVNLEYKVKHTKMTSVEDFIVIDAGTGYKVSMHMIRQEGK